MQYTEQIAEGVNFKVIPATHFKSEVISLYIRRTLTAETVTMNNILPGVLSDGTEKYPTETHISDRLDELYGASLSMGTDKSGETQVIRIQCGFLSPKYSYTDIIEDVLDLISELLLHPYLENGAFSHKYTELEKNAQKELILSSINDKAYYAKQKLIAHMCEKEPFGIPEYGYISDLDLIDEKKLYDCYREVIKTSPIDIIYTGAEDKEKVSALIKAHFNFSDRNIVKIPEPKIDVKVKKPKYFEEKMDIVQAKLVMGFRTYSDVKTDDEFTDLVYAMVLGGGAQSKLFRNVREKHSLCYSISASMSKYKGLMFIQTGIKTSDYDKAKNLIEKELDDMKNGEITEEELSQAKKLLVGVIRSVNDRVYSLSDFYYDLGIFGKNLNLEEIVDKINAVTVKSIRKRSEKITLDTVFLLKGEE